MKRFVLLLTSALLVVGVGAAMSVSSAGAATSHAKASHAKASHGKRCHCRRGRRGKRGKRGRRGPRGPIGPIGPTGPAGPAGPTGATGAQGASGANTVLFSSGGDNTSANHYVGVGGQSTTEANVQQIMDVAGSATTMSCFSSVSVSADTTFTLRKNGADTALTCTILNGSTTGSGTSAAESWVAGDLLDVHNPGALPNQDRVSFAIG